MLEIVDTDALIGFAKDDPVRPHISEIFRVSENRTMFALLNEDTFDIRAMICVAWNETVCIAEECLQEEGETVATFYTVWSYDKGAGREIIQCVVDWIKENKPNIKRYITLSPKTDMARRFHTRNGAVELQQNKDTVNYEYLVE